MFFYLNENQSFLDKKFMTVNYGDKANNFICLICLLHIIFRLIQNNY